MHGIDRQYLFGALLLLATAAFLIAIAPGVRYRRAARRIAVAIYAVLFLGVAAWAALWFLGVRF